ncbi:class I SAM-dependent methyltransferase [Actinopolymorpha alba]|uniref:class I SAM-dependent methyltransferase n=1 Tax=Actinopolymorpha alba TaxID=533267 RepID=UPI0003734F6A|nr:class I SAM-dependent methyltransferase [Actinopolymorpha alba]
MHRHEFLRKLHEVSKPRTYFEVGINDGRSLTLSRVPTVAVDPAFKVVKEVRCDLHMIRETSDDFFAREEPFEHLQGAKVDLAFIDGMHLFDFALRDFINAEPHLDWTSVVVLDDMMPRNIPEAARDRHTTAWTGDVYKVIPVLQRYRPDLRLAVVDTQPTGVVVVLGVNPTNTALADKYDEILETYAVPDPQQVPDVLLNRTIAMRPEELLEAPFWSSLVAAREDESTEFGPDELRATIDESLSLGSRTSLAGWQPEPQPAPADNAVSGEVATPEAARAVTATVPTPQSAGGISQRITRAAAGNPGLWKLGKGVVNRLPLGWRRSIRKHVYQARRTHV